MLALFVIFAVVVAFATSCTYIYAFRGQEEFESLREYLRKGWPIFAPLNCFLYLFTESRATPAIMNINDFPELDLLKENWQTIRDEALVLQQQNIFDSINDPGQDAHYDVGFHTFHKYGWRKFYVKWYGYNHASAMRLCPKTVELVNQIPSINGAMFSILPPHSKLTRHLDPVAVSLRYHLGLATPNADECFINIDGQTYSWRDGSPLLFDETYIHFVNNNTDQHRLILMCDVERPVRGVASAVYTFYRSFMKGTIAPNTTEDKSGWISLVFRKIQPLQTRGKRLKASNRKLYKTLKFIVNAIILVIILVTVGGLFQVAFNTVRLLDGS